MPPSTQADLGMCEGSVLEIGTGALPTDSAERQVSMSSFRLKGGGWYKDGYSNNESEKQKTEKSGKEGSSKSSKEPTTIGDSPVPERPSKTDKKESNSNTIAKTSSKEKAT